ncbi:MAG: pyridoxal 5'-phosphate synthase glutaminase subunit PdxT, partial [Thermovirga sp.]|nr:pyridoxal 5'-phosphate synthase glutaminase subunit PdxT [Thermovirga sp.]
NAYGRQIDSFTENIKIKDFNEPFEAIFIRAPQVTWWGPEVEVLATLDGYPVMLRQKNVLVTSFHPELTDDTRVHEYFLGMTKN